MLLTSYFIDKKTKRDYSFWLYIFGMLAFWGGLNSGFTDALVLKIIYCVINLFFIFIAVAFQRKLFIVFGAIGVFIFLADLSFSVFHDSFSFPIILSLIGVLFILAVIFYAKNKNRIDMFIDKKTPAFVKSIVPVKKE